MPIRREFQDWQSAMKIIELLVHTNSRIFPATAGWRKIPPMIDKDLLEILVCPACKKPVTVQGNGESLKCSECRRVYPIRDNIPVMLIDEATIDPS